MPPSQESEKAPGWSAAGRALISGYVDSYSLLKFGAYASFITGNTTSTGLHAGQAKLAEARYSLLPIPFFVLGIFKGTLLAQADFERAVLNRVPEMEAHPERHFRQVLLLCDEYQHLATGDEKFFSLSRQPEVHPDRRHAEHQFAKFGIARRQLADSPPNIPHKDLSVVVR